MEMLYEQVSGLRYHPGTSQVQLSSTDSTTTFSHSSLKF
jgi:hypothetical protein